MKRSNLWLAEMESRREGGVRTTQLTSGTSLDVSPRFSPDGRSIAFVRGNNLFVLRLDGSAPEPLTFGDADHFAPAWSPDGREIAFVSQERATSRVSRISASGGDARPFTRTVGSGDRAGDLAWSPGKRILYQKSANRNFGLLDPATEEETPLLKNESLGRLWRPRYSPDATRVVVFRQETDGTGRGISVISVESSAEQRVFDGFAWPLGWSPDGASVYVVASAKIGPAMTFTDPEILKIPARGGPAVEVAKLPFKEVNIADGGNDVSSDGRRFVFSVPDTRSDTWLVENFDPDRQRE
jgi:Tol biopolymer transport system component